MPRRKNGISPGVGGSSYFKGQRYANCIGGSGPRVNGPIRAAWAELDLIMLPYHGLVREG